MHSIVIRQQETLLASWPGYPAWLTGLLRARGVETPQEAQAFLHPHRSQILSPFALQGMEKARALLLQAVAEKKRIVIYGDYDCDGVCACAILQEALAFLGAQVTCYIPHRHKEGYGLNLPAVEQLAKEHDVMVTVDCGITSVSEVARAKEMGMTVIVTDHHTVGETLPPADAVISPLVGGYPFSGLCGAGVAWKLALAIAGEQAEELMELAALATVADMVPLLQENRALVKLGLEKLGQTTRPGLLTLMQLAGVEGRVSAQQVSFQLAPRLNACGRMDSARIALDLLCTRDAQQALTLARQAHALNEQRKQLENDVLGKAREQVAQMDLQHYHALVVCGEDWNSGVVGLAAGKLAEQWGYPAVALSREGETCVGSARSAGKVDIYAALKTCEDLFVRFGGHRQAAGMTLPADRVEELRNRLSQAVKEQLGDQAPRKQYLCDGEMPLKAVTEEAVEQLNQLEPFGVGNPLPIFCARHAKALNLRAVGTEGAHLQCMFQQGEALRSGIYFGGGAYQGQEGTFSLVFALGMNEFRGKKTAQLQLKYMEPEPEKMEQNTAREARSLSGAPRSKADGSGRISTAQLDAMMQGSQGTLLVCRCLETARKMHRQYPEASFTLENADDPRAYHTILLYADYGKACAPFRHVVLCDGELMESAAWQTACPGAQVHWLEESDAVCSLARQMMLDKEALRRAYKGLKQPGVRDMISFSEAAELTLPQAFFALRALCEAGLISYQIQPFFVQLLPWKSGEKHDPSESEFYRLIHTLTEA